MDQDRFAQLSERQRQCLRLCYANLSVKEIGAELGLSPFTVREHLRDARRILRVNRSMQAARLLVHYERDTLGVPLPNRIGLDRQFPDEGSAIAHATARNRYPLGVLQRFGLIVAIAFGAVALAGALLVGAEAITWIFRAEGIDISDYPTPQ
jgi:DNA-binding CsgD family transcriptional regulator